MLLVTDSVERWDRAGLEASGFVGFVRFGDLAAAEAPQSGGVYVVLRESDVAPVFLDVSTGGHFKGKDPTVAIAMLANRWVEGCETIYVGKATDLRERLRQYRDFGRGKPVGHWGGRYVWQLSDAASLVVAWRTSADLPRDVEKALLADFRTRHGRLPFANISS